MQLTSAGRSTLSTLFAILAALQRHDDDRKSAKDFRFLEIYTSVTGIMPKSPCKKDERADKTDKKTVLIS